MTRLNLTIEALSRHPQVTNKFTVRFNNIVNARLKALGYSKLPPMKEYLKEKTNEH